MYQPNFCVECGVPMTRRWWQFFWGHLCAHCAPQFIRQRIVHLVLTGIVLLITGFVIGRHLRSPPPPLTIERSANSPLSDLPITLNDRAIGSSRRSNAESDSSPATRVAAEPDEAVYICGARTKKGTPCRRRVHVAGDRCYQHKGKPAMVPLEQLAIKGD